MGQKKRSDATFASVPATDSDSPTDSRFIPAGDADLVAAFTDGDYTAAQLPQALDEYDGTGLDRCLADAMELRSLLHDNGWLLDTAAVNEDFAVFVAGQGAAGATSLSMGVDWPTNPITGLPQARYDLELSAPVAGAPADSTDGADELADGPRREHTAVRFRSVADFAPYASVVRGRTPDQWPDELQGKRFDPDQELDAFLAAAE